MTTTARQILTAAAARDALIDLSAATQQFNEVVAAIGRSLRKRMGKAIPGHPELFGTILHRSFVVEGAISGWKRPDDAHTVFRLEATSTTVANPAIAAGAEVKVVPFDDRAFIAGEPAVFELGGFYVTAGNAGDPTGGGLNVFYAPHPAAPASITSNIDTRFPDALADFLVADLNVWFAKREGRDPALFVAEVTEWEAIFAEWVASGSINTTRRNT